MDLRMSHTNKSFSSCTAGAPLCRDALHLPSFTVTCMPMRISLIQVLNLLTILPLLTIRGFLNCVLQTGVPCGGCSFELPALITGRSTGSFAAAASGSMKRTS